MSARITGHFGEKGVTQMETNMMKLVFASSLRERRRRKSQTHRNCMRSIWKNGIERR